MKTKIKIGGHYSKGEVGIPKGQFQKAHCKTSSAEYFFATIWNKEHHQNELQYDGLVIGASKNSLPYSDKNNITNRGRRIMVRFNTNSQQFEYIGDEDYRIRYDDKREKIFLIRK